MALDLPAFEENDFCCFARNLWNRNLLPNIPVEGNTLLSGIQDESYCRD
jgi:hypothetical protein